MALPMKQISLSFLLFTCTLGLESVHAFAPKIGSIANAVESIAKLFKAAGKAPVPADKLDDLAKNLPSGARTVIEKLAKASPELRRVATPEFLSFVAKNPEFASDAAAVLKKFPSEQCGVLLTRLSKESPMYCQKAVKHMAGSCSEETVSLLARSIDGKTVSNKQILSVVNDFKSIGDNSRTAAEVFEVIARNQLATGINRINTGLMKYSRVVEGQYNAIHGIDGIGVALDGRPVLMEFTIDGSKNLAKTEQLSGAWCAKKWNLLIDANPGLKDELIEAGMKPEHWRKITADEALKWPRKLIAPDPRCLNETNRLASGLDANDLILLGN